MSARRDRYRQVIETLTRHGLGFLVGTPHPFSRLPSDVGSATTHAFRLHTRPEHVRLALEELGATFIKLGQIVSTRADLLPPAYTAELAKLQEAASPVPAEAVRAAIADELGRDVDDVYEEFDDSPLASASIGQAHAARFRGVDVVVKVRRPGVVEQVALDLDILRNLAAMASRTWEAAKDYDVVGLVEEFSDTLRAELDYLREAENIDRFVAAYATDPRVHIPVVVREATTSRVLTLERLWGIRIDDVAGLDGAGIDRRALAVNASSVLLEMALDDGFFHADPHPGNFMVEPDGCIGLIDFGMVGHLDDQLRERLVRFAVAVSRRDADLATSALLSICGTSWTPDREALTASLAHMLARYPQRRLGEMPTARIVLEFAGLLRTHRLHLPLQLSLLLKAVVMADGLGKRLDPDFDLLGMLRPFVRRMVLRSLGPSAMLRRLTSVLQEAVELGLDAPDIIRRVVSVLERGGFDVHLRAAELDPLVARAERIGNRIVAGAIISAFISGMAKIVAGDPRLGSWERPMIAAGFGSLGALGGYLAVTGRHRRLNRL